MKTFRWWNRHRALLGSVTSASAVALIVTGVPAMALATHPASHASPGAIGPGLPAAGWYLHAVHQLPAAQPHHGGVQRYGL